MILYPRGASSPVVKKFTKRNKSKITIIVKKIFLFLYIFFNKSKKFIID